MSGPPAGPCRYTAFGGLLDWATAGSPTSMCQCVNDEVDSQPVRVTRKIVRILRLVGPFISIAQVGVVVNHHDKPAVLVPNAFALCYKTVLLPRNSAVVHVGQAWDLDDLVDVVEEMKNGVIFGNILDLCRR